MFLNAVCTWHSKVRVVGIFLAVLLGLSIGSYFIGNGYLEIEGQGLHMRCERLEFMYWAANQTSREIYCKIRNTGNADAILKRIWVNRVQVSTQPPLPIWLEVWDYTTIVFRYEGAWEGSILIHAGTESTSYEMFVDLEVASSNPIADAYPSVDEIYEGYTHKIEYQLGFERGQQRGSAQAAAGVVIGLLSGIAVGIVVAFLFLRRKD